MQDLIVIEQNKKINQNVRMLCLYIRLLKPLIPLEDLIKTQMNNDNSQDYYDMCSNTILIKNNIILLPQMFKDEINDISKFKLKTYLFPNKDDTGYILLHNLYKAFKTATGISYATVITQNVQIDNDKSTGIAWSECRLPIWKNKTYEIYTYALKKLQLALWNNDNTYLPELYIKHANSVISYIDSLQSATSSKELYLRAILVFLQHFSKISQEMSMEIFARYTIEKNKYENADIVMKEVPNYGLIVKPRFEEILLDENINANIKITILIFLKIGVLRYSDLVWTKINQYYDETCEYSQLCPDYYYISGRYTKNGRDRKFKLPHLFYDIIINEYKKEPGQMLIDSHITPSILAKEIKTVTGFNLNILRGSIETYAIKNYTKEKSEELSYAMGHIFKTVIKYYYRE